MKKSILIITAVVAVLLASILTAGCTGSPEPTGNITGTWVYTGGTAGTLYIETTEVLYTITLDSDEGMETAKSILTKISPAKYADRYGYTLYELGGMLIMENSDGVALPFERYYGNVPKPTPTTKPTQQPTQQPTPKPTVKPTPKPTPSATTGEQNALKSAQMYLDIGDYSEAHLKEQLEFEGFTPSEINYALKNVKVDWNEECVQTLNAYLKFSSYSKQRMIEQLEFEGYTKSQINYAMKKAWID